MAVKKAIKKTLKSQVMPVPLVIDKSSVKDRLKQPKIFIPLIVIILAGILFYFRGLFVAAIVNGKPIARLEIIAELEKRSGKQVLSQLVTQTLVLQEARKKNITVSQKEIDNAINQIASGLSSQGQSLDQALAVQGMTKNDLIAQVRIQKIIEKMFGANIKITDQEISDYISKNKDSFSPNMKEPEIKKGVAQQLTQQRISEGFQTWLTNAQKNAKINYFVNY